ncbi:DNA-binding protein [Alcanivoracaceae bacterium MT1]
MIPELGDAISNGPEWPPLMGWKDFAEWIRQKPDVVRGWVEKGHLPTVRVGSRRMINVVLLVEQLREGEV